MRKFCLNIVFAGCCVVLASCQGTSGVYRNFKLSCSEISPYFSEMNWEIWGKAKKIEKCSGGTDFLEKYALSKGFIIYQGLSNIDSYFPTITERTFREALSGQTGLESNWKSIQINQVSTGSRNVNYSIFNRSNSGAYCAYFRMGHGNRMMFDGGDGWNEIAHGTVCGPTGMTLAEFQKAFESRIQVFNVRTNKGEKNTAGYKSWD